MRVLLTGAFGNVGSHTLPELVRQGHRVRCFDRPAAANRRRARRIAAARRPGEVEFRWGDVRDADAVRAAAHGVEAIVHLAALIPPASDDDPDLARSVNVDGTRNVVDAARAQADPPRLLLASTLDVHGRTQDRSPPRRVDDPVVGTDPYTTHKIACEELVRGSGLAWCVLRFADVPVLGPRPAHPIMFEIGLHNRIEAVHADDVALAVTNALGTPEVWQRVLFVGGGPTCQVTYGEYLATFFAAMGMKPLPERAFATTDYVTDWLDTAESQRLLRYQRHDLAGIAAAIAANLGWRRRLLPVVAPLVRRAILRMSPYRAVRRGPGSVQESP
jgi:nucleoside-diphosphate-sugar epimerase